jgi:hypothetical protein
MKYHLQVNNLIWQRPEKEVISNIQYRHTPTYAVVRSLKVRYESNFAQVKTTCIPDMQTFCCDFIPVIINLNRPLSWAKRHAVTLQGHKASAIRGYYDDTWRTCYDQTEGGRDLISQLTRQLFNKASCLHIQTVESLICFRGLLNVKWLLYMRHQSCIKYC